MSNYLFSKKMRSVPILFSLLFLPNVLWAGAPTKVYIEVHAQNPARYTPGDTNVCIGTFKYYFNNNNEARDLTAMTILALPSTRDESAPERLNSFSHGPCEPRMLYELAVEGAGLGGE